MKKRSKKFSAVFLSLVLLLGTIFQTMANVASAETPPYEPQYITPEEIFIMKVEKGTDKDVVGATLTLTKQGQSNPIREWKTAAKTKEAFKLSDLTKNTEYTLSEKEAPTGYKKANDIVFKFDDSGVYIKNGENWDKVTTFEEKQKFQNAAYNDFENEETPWVGKSYEKKYFLEQGEKDQVLYCINLTSKGPPDGCYGGEIIDPDISTGAEVKYTKSYEPNGLITYVQNPRVEDPNTFYQKIRRILYAGYPNNVGDSKIANIQQGINSVAYKLITQLAIYYYTDSFDITKHKGDGHGFEEILQESNKNVFEAYQRLLAYAESTDNAPPTNFMTNLFKPNIGYYQNLIGTEFSQTGLGYVIKMEDEVGFEVREKAVTFSKVNANGTIELKNAHLTVVEGEYTSGDKTIAKDSKTNEALSWISDGNTKTFTLKVGKYTLIEDQAPLGYDKAENIAFEITKDDKILIKQTDDTWKEAENSTVQMKDNRLSSVLPGIKTTVKANGITGDGTKSVEATVTDTNNKVNVVDHIAYENLEKGKIYTVTGTLKELDKDGSVVKDIKQVTYPLEAKESTGTWDIDFTEVELEAGKKYVVFEKVVSVENLVDLNEDGEYDVQQGSEADTINVYKNTGKSLLSHEDPTDVAQTIVVKGLKGVTFSKKAVNGTDELVGAQLTVVVGDNENSTSIDSGKIARDSLTSETLSWKSESTAKKYTLAEGTYTLIENQAPLGYAIAENIVFRVTSDKKIEIKQADSNWVEQADSTVVMKDAPKGKIDFTKYDTDTTKTLAGAVIQIIDSNNKIIVEGTTTGDGKLTKASTIVGKDNILENGNIALDEGTYSIVEKAAPADYVHDPGNPYTITGVTVKNGEKITQSITNKKKITEVKPTEVDSTSGLKLKKIDYDSYMKNGEKSAAAAPEGAVIGIYLENGTLVAKGRTTDDGTFDTVTDVNAAYCSGYDTAREVVKLKIGKYYVQEISEQTGYFLNQEKVYFEITADNKQEVAVYYTNLKKEHNGTLILKKIDESGNAINGGFFAISKRKYQPKDGSFSLKPFLQVKIGNDGKPTQDGSIGRTELIQDGKIYLYPQEAGSLNSYVIQEIVPPAGYKLDSKPIEFDIKAGKETKIQNQIAQKLSKDGFVNKKVTGTLDFTKTRFATSDPVAGATMEIYNNNDSANPVLILSTKTNAQGKFDKTSATKGGDLINTEGNVELEPGKYYFKETKAPDGYILNPEKHPFEIKANEVVVDTLKNEKANLFKLIKKGSDGVTETSLAAAEIKVFGADGTELLKATTGSNGLLIESSASGPLKDEGRITTEGILKLRAGNYYYTEVKTPEGYVPDTKNYYFSITGEETAIIEKTLVNIKKKPKLATTVDIGSKKAKVTEPLRVNEGKFVVKDTISYEELESGKQYNVTGRLMKIVEGKDPQQIATKTDTLKADSSGKGTWNITFDKVKLEAGAKYVVFEKAEPVDNTSADKVISHENPNDLAQTILVSPKPSLKTTVEANDTERTDLSKAAIVVLADGTTSVNVKDNITYTGLTIGEKYNVTASLIEVDAAGNKVGEAIKVVAEEKEASADGTWVMDFGSVSGLKPGTKYVVFENVVSVDNLVDTDGDGEPDAKQGSEKDTVNRDANGKSLLSHEDTKDIAQTMVILNNGKPSISTTVEVHKQDGVLLAKGSNSAPAEVNSSDVNNLTIIDNVDYKNFVRGKEYAIRGTLIKVTEENGVISRSRVKVENASFNAENSDGSVKLEFKNINLDKDARYVVFEEAVSKEMVDRDLDGVAESYDSAKHDDINDKAQTIITKGDVPSTGGTTPITGGTTPSTGGTTPTTPEVTKPEASKPKVTKPEASKPKEDTSKEEVVTKKVVKEIIKNADKKENKITKENEPVVGVIELQPDEEIEVKVEPEHGIVEIDDTGIWSYTPKDGFVGKDRFVATITKPDDSTEDVLINIDVEPTALGTTKPNINKKVAKRKTLPKTGSKNDLSIIGFGLIAGALLLQIKNSKRKSKAN